MNRHCRPWEEWEDDVLRQATFAGKGCAEVAKRLGRTATAVRVRRQVIGIANSVPVSGFADAHFNQIPAPAETPTDASPGSEEKIFALAARYASGQELHHPQDERTCRR